MNRIIFFLILVLSAFSVFAQNAELVYIDGWVDIRSAGDVFEAFPGDVLKSGDAVITGSDSYAELEQADLSTITVKPDSVFTIQELETASGKETVLSTTLGAVSFKFGKLAGKEPMVSTPSMTAGIRGTEFTIYAGEDGSSLVAVTSGLVSVESEGESVELSADEGVEIVPGEAPGKKFSLLGRELDFSTWNAEKYDILIADPVTGAGKLSRQMDTFLNTIVDYNGTLTDLMSEKEELKLEWNKILEEKGKDAGSVYFSENIRPLDRKTGRLFLNIRYYTLSALSMRRYILGRLYLDMKGRYITDPFNPDYQEFLSVYKNIMNNFEVTAAPFLGSNDI